MTTIFSKPSGSLCIVMSALGTMFLVPACGDPDVVDATPCQDDFDCKGDRVCVEGLCADPGGSGSEGPADESSTDGGSTDDDGSSSDESESGDTDNPPDDPNCVELNGELVCAQTTNPGPTEDEMLAGTVPPPPGPLPDSRSLDLTGFTIPNQGSCGSCVAFSVRSSMGLRATEQIDQFTNFSPAHIWAIADYGSDDCGTGSSITTVFKQNRDQLEHTVSNQIWPYNPGDPTTSLDNPPASMVLEANGIAHVGSYTHITNGNSLEIKYAIAQSWPAVIGVPVYWSDWNDGDLTEVHGPQDTPDGYHAITVVAYDDATDRFRFANSWGLGFGNGGYGTMTYDFVEAHAFGGIALQNLVFNDPGAVCGDGVASGDEACDGNDLGGQSCQSQGFDKGTLACAGDCTYDTSACCDDNDAYQCVGGDVYWYDSCGQLGAKKQECGAGECYDLDAETAECELCQCNSGVCCDGCGYRDASYVCDIDAQSENGCPWGIDPGDDVGVRSRDRYCSGASSACAGNYGAWSNWSVADACSVDEVCEPGDATCNPAPCLANAYYQCYAGDVYYYDSCDQLGTKKQECGVGQCFNTGNQTAECEVCECNLGACCDGCSFRSSNYVCQNDAVSEYDCPWGVDPGDDVGVRTRDRYCSGASSSCSGNYGAWSGWSVADFCSNAEVCQPGDSTCNPAPNQCAAATYWSPSLDSDTDNTGLQNNQSINVSIRMEVRETGNQLQFRVCKLNDVFQGNVKVAIYDAATNSQVGVLVNSLNTAGQTCSSWTDGNLLNDGGYLEGEVFGGVWNVVSPSTSAGDWPTWGGCSVNGNPTGTCWSGINITMTRTCKGF